MLWQCCACCRCSRIGNWLCWGSPSVLTGVYALGHISGAHFNPAVSVGLWMGNRFEGKELPGYIIAQVLGGIAGAGILFLIASGNPNFSFNDGFAANGFANLSPHGYSMTAALVSEVVMTFMFVIVILGATHKNASPGFAGFAIGLSFTLIHLISIPVTNTSVNPARSTSQALFVGGENLSQLRLFWITQIVGALLAGLLYKFLVPK